MQNAAASFAAKHRQMSCAQLITVSLNTKP